MIIYKGTNTKNGKIYIGQAEDFEDRKRTRKNQALNGNRTDYIDCAIRKHGWDAFIWEIIDSSDDPIELDEKEKYWIEILNARDRNIGYNLAEGGRINRGYKWTEDAKKRRSEVVKEQFRNGRENWCKGKTGCFSEESRKKHSETLKEGYANGTIKKCNLGLPLKEETKIKIAKTLLGNIPWNKGRSGCYSEDTINRMAKSLKDGYANGSIISPTKKSIKCVETGQIFESVQSAKKIGGSHVPDAASGKRKMAGGYHWEYVDKPKEISKDSVI